MALRTQYLPESPQFELFLFSLIGEEKNGMPLTVMSALVRFGADPWREAARLAALPKAVALEALVTLVSSLPQGRWNASDTVRIANSLVELLPSSTASIDVRDAGDPGRRRSRTAMWVIWLLLASLLLFGANQLAPQPQLPSISGASSTDPV